MRAPWVGIDHKTALFLLLAEEGGALDGSRCRVRILDGLPINAGFGSGSGVRTSLILNDPPPPPPPDPQSAKKDRTVPLIIAP